MHLYEGYPFDDDDAIDALNERVEAWCAGRGVDPMSVLTLACQAGLLDQPWTPPGGHYDRDRPFPGAAL